MKEKTRTVNFKLERGVPIEESGRKHLDLKEYKDNLSMHQELLRQSKIVEKAEKYENERDKIIADNRIN